MFKRVIKEELKIPAEIDYLGDLRDFITKVSRKYGVSESIINAFKLAIDEAGTNIIRHAYRDWEGFITLRILVREQTVTISLIDQGHAFDPRNVKDPDLQRYVDIGKKGGLGVFIIRRVIDEIDYRKTEEGNELRLTKKRESSKRPKLAMPDVSFNMKTRFFLVGSGILSAIVIGVFLFQYLRVNQSILNEDLSTGWALARSAAQRSADLLLEEAAWDLATLASEFHKEYKPLVWDVVILDSAKVIQGTNNMDLLLRAYTPPSRFLSVAEGVKSYTIPGEKAVYDITHPVLQAGSGWRLGTVHLLLDKAVIDSAVANRKQALLAYYAMVLFLGNVGIALLIWVTMSPFRKLAGWVKELGQGGSPDEMDFDASDEIGEIAKAFNEITEKFRKSQVNLAEQERLQKEMQVAQEIQQTLLPDSFPDIEGYELASYYEAAKEVGGDYFDFVQVDKDTLGIVVADVSGKGVPGSLVMTMIRTALRTEARGNKNAADVLARVNEFVMNDMKRGMFVTVFYIILDSKNRTINYASAGHNPMILYRGSSQKSYYLNPRGFPIGISLPDKALFRNSIESDSLRLKQDDVLLVFTDGITEAMNSDRDQYGDERFLEAIRRHGHCSAEPLVEKLHDELDVFTQGSPQNDDITLVAIREKMNAEDVLYNRRHKLLRLINEEGMSVKAACAQEGISTSTYYKYKKRFDKEGDAGLRDKVSRSEIEEKHFSIEDKAKIFDIIKKNPAFGAKRIAEELNTAPYGETVIDQGRIYEELVRSRLNTRELREAFVERGDRRKFKQPGTPMLTMDGQVIKNIKPTLPSFPLQDQDKEAIEPPVPSLTGDSDETIGQEADAETAEVDSFLDDFLDMQDAEEEVFSTPLDMEEAFADGADAASSEDRPLEALEMAEHAEADTDTAFDDFLGLELGEGEAKESTVDSTAKMEKDSATVEDGFADDFQWEDLLADAAEMSEADAQEGAADLTEVKLDEVLAIDDQAFEDIEGDEAHIEEKIAASSLDDLMREFLGDKAEDSEAAEAPAEGGFIEMMEDLGFDRRNMLSGEEGLAEETLVAAQPMLDAERIFNGAMDQYQAGQYQNAVAEFERVLEINPRDGSAYQCLGDAYFRLGELNEARSAYEEARALLPENVAVLENLGVIFANMGEYKKAVWQWGEVLKRHPERKDIIQRIKKMQRMIRQRYL